MSSLKFFLLSLFLLLSTFQFCKGTQGFAYCSGCSSTCCYWSFDSSATTDPNCTDSYECNCHSINLCDSSSTTTTLPYSAGNRQCSYSVCTSQCCHYNSASSVQDFYCTNILNCYCTTLSNCGSGSNTNTDNVYTCNDYFNNYTQSSSGGVYNYYASWWYADCLSVYSGQTYVAVSYPGWKAVVAVGSVLDGLLAILIVYLVYYKCYQKPKNYNNPIGGLNQN